MKQDSQLYAFRRHLLTCAYFGPGSRETRSDKCSCPFHVDGLHNGQRVRQSLKTRGRQLADRRLNDLVRALDAKVVDSPDRQSAPASVGGPAERPVAEAAERFLASHGAITADGEFRGDIEHSSWRKYRTKLELFSTFCRGRSIAALTDVTLEVLEDYRRARIVSAVTWKVELQALRTFFGYCIRHKWITVNPAHDMKPPRNIKPNEVIPYTPREEAEILAACDQIGGGKHNRSGAGYEQIRARAMVMLLRHTALRISDVCTLGKDAVSRDEEKATWRVMLRTQKSGEPVYLPIPATLKAVLDLLPLPRNAAQECPYYFWNGHTARRAVVGIAERTLTAVFKKSGVKHAHAHRFRHTLATRLLERGATFEQVADILGNSPAVVRKHYGKWSKGRQDNIDRLMMDHFQAQPATFPVTKKSHEKTGAVN